MRISAAQAKVLNALYTTGTYDCHTDYPPARKLIEYGLVVGQLYGVARFKLSLTGVYQLWYNVPLQVPKFAFAATTLDDLAAKLKSGWPERPKIKITLTVTKLAGVDWDVLDKTEFKRAQALFSQDDLVLSVRKYLT